jgi:CRISPR-associated exonuclease Cas4
VFDPTLRARTEAAAARLHALIASGHTPAAIREPKCESCSLLELCLPATPATRGSADAYIEHALAETLARPPAQRS